MQLIEHRLHLYYLPDTRTVANNNLMHSLFQIGAAIELLLKEPVQLHTQLFTVRQEMFHEKLQLGRRKRQQPLLEVRLTP
jgi:hypothetical protein